MLLMEEARKIAFWENDLLIKTLSGDEELRAAYRLRHQVFADRLRWVERNPEELEIDVYDSFATSVGIFDDNRRLLGVFRMVNSSFPFMLESEFRACLLPTCVIRKSPDTAEITRFAIDPTVMDRGLSNRLMQVLVKGVYQWAIHNDVRYMYMVVENRFLRTLRGMGITCEAISPAVSLPPAHALSVAAVLDWGQFRPTSSQKRASYYRWMSTIDGSNPFQRSAFAAMDPKEGGGRSEIHQSALCDQEKSREEQQDLVAA